MPFAQVGLAMTQIAQWFASLLLIALSLYVGIGQWWAIHAIPRRLNAQGQHRNYSMIPLIGGVIGTGGCLLSPMSAIKQLWWLPLIIDPGCALLFGCIVVFGIVAGAKRFFNTSAPHSDETSKR